jgi:MoxR-like ATPase
MADLRAHPDAAPVQTGAGAGDGGGTGGRGGGSDSGLSPAATFGAIVDSVRSVLFTDLSTARLAVGCLLAGGHLLVEDLPGVGKTTLAKALARSFGLDFQRVQCTADLLPADIVGAMVFDHDGNEPIFRPGPVFTNVLMADELNRASTRAQSALLEAMEERQVSMDGTSRPLPDPFMVVATQNPYDAAGTSPLPHGQRDRFLLRLSLGYPNPDDEDALLARANRPAAVDAVGPAVSKVELSRLMDAVTAVHVSPLSRHYVGALAQASRRHPSVAVGASPRAAMALIRTGSALAVADGRGFVTAGDIETACEPALAHRLQLSPEAEVSGVEPADIVRELLDLVPVPLGDEAPPDRD